MGTKNKDDKEQETGQLALIDIGPEHSEEIRECSAKYKAIIKKRLAMQAKEAELKAELRGLIVAEHLTRLEDGSIRCRVEGFKIVLEPTDEKLTVTELKE